MSKVSALYPGSFDPPTNGHLDLIERGAKIFEELVVGILRNTEKSPMFSLAERLEMLKTLTAHLKNVRIEAFHGLMVEYAKSIDATCVLRGIRAVSDYEYELQMALMNRKLEPTLETVFMMPADKYSYVSSRLVREVAQIGGPVKGLVPEVVEQKLREKLEPAYKFHDEMQAATARASRRKREKEEENMTTAITEALKLTDRINRIEPSATMAVVAEADKLRAQGIDVVDFGAGEPHFATPQHIKDAAIAAIQGNFTKYTAVPGTPELRDAIVHRHAVDFDSDYRREEAIASTGGKNALFNASSGARRSRRRSDFAGSLLGFVQGHRTLCRRPVRIAAIG